MAAGRQPSHFASDLDITAQHHIIRALELAIAGEPYDMFYTEFWMAFKLRYTAQKTEGTQKEQHGE